MNEALRLLLFLPVQASTVAAEVDWLHYLVISATMAGAVVVTLAAVYYVVRYRRDLSRTDDPNPDAAARTHFLYKLGSLILLAGLFLAFWAIGARQYMRMRVAPAETMDIHVTAKKWMWKFAYPEGARSIGVLYVPAGRPVRLLMTSRDVIHSFFVPAFRVKHDVLPGRFTTLWFEVKEPGTHEILCTEYCGTGHSTMRGQVVALSAEDFARWLRAAPERQPLAGPVYREPALGLPGAAAPAALLDLASMGERVAADKGCLRCHTLDGSPHLAPSFAGLYRALVPLEGGGEVIADEAYLTESMMDPRARLHRGFAAIMPSYLGLLDAPEVAALVELIKSRRDVPPAPALPPAPEEGSHGP